MNCYSEWFGYNCRILNCIDANGNHLTDRMLEILIEDFNESRVVGVYNCMFLVMLLSFNLYRIYFC